MARVLVVDDEPDILLVLRLTLEAAGFETALAADGDVALQLLRRQRFDAVILDIMMPVLDGWGVLEALRGHEEAPPVAVLTAKAAPADVRRARELGAAKYLTKPFQSRELVQCINSLAGLDAGSVSGSNR